MSSERKWVRDTLVPMMQSQDIDERSISRVLWWMSAFSVARSIWSHSTAFPTGHSNVMHGSK